MSKFTTGLIVVIVLGSNYAVAQEDQTKIIDGVNYVGVSVSDLDRSVNYYQSAADLSVVEEKLFEDSAILNALAGRQSVTANSSLLRGANAQLRFMQFDNPSTAAMESEAVEVHGTGLVHICFQVAHTTETYQKFLASGATPIGAAEMITLNPRNPVVYAYARDADEIISEVEHIDFGQLTRPKKYDYRIRHISLASHDIDRLVDFYSVLMEEPDPRRLGPLEGENFDMVSGYEGTKMEMAWFQTRNLEIEIVEYLSHPPAPLREPRPIDAIGYNMVVFDVSSLAAAREKLLAGGGTVVTEVEQLDGGQIFFGRDPDGNLLGFQTVSADAVISSKNFADNGT